MKRSYLVGGILTAAVLTAAGVGIDAALAPPSDPATPPSAASTAAAPGAQIGAAALPPGTALVDDHGRTLYLFEADTGTTSACTGLCAQVWPPLLTQDSAPAAVNGVRAELVGSTARADGTRQVTYNGHPLYTFTGDRNPGETRGQGLDRFGGPWYVVAPTGDKIDAESPADAATPGY